MIDLDELERLHKAAREGVWSISTSTAIGGSVITHYRGENLLIGEIPLQRNAAFIAAIKNACDDGLLERLRTAERERDEFAEMVRDYAAMQAPGFSEEMARERDKAIARAAKAEATLWESDSLVLLTTMRAEAAEASLAALKAENERLRKAGRDLLQYVDDQTCTHESVHRGGTIWTICDECGKEWADDKGGFQPHEDAPAVAAFRTALEITND